nr:MAG TPA: hypothetical protein [Caudoviricetes sp.]
MQCLPDCFINMKFTVYLWRTRFGATDKFLI